MNTSPEIWWGQVIAAEHNLCYLLQNYHPVNLRPNQMSLPITAPNAEIACASVGEEIRKNFEGDPVKEFKAAIQARDAHKVTNLLNDAWFGVPESTACWTITGFREAIMLLEDPPL
jgi:hypothetical protein